MSNSTLPRGVLTATLTPFHSDLTPNHELLYTHCQNLIDRGGHGIALLGTTGEANSISLEHRMGMLEGLLERGFEAERIIAGTSTCSLHDSVTLTKHAVMCGVNNVLIMPPFYYRNVTDDGLCDWFTRFIDGVASIDLRIYLYHFPKMSGIDISLRLIERLIDKHGVVIAGMKDSSGDLEHMLSVLSHFPALRLYSGNEKLLVPVLEAGGVGTITATTNYNVEAAANVFESWNDGNLDRESEKEMVAVREAFEGHLFPAALKGVLTASSKPWSDMIPPIQALPDETIKSLIDTLKNVSSNGN